MADDKKRDYTIELGDRQPNAHFEAAPKPAPPTMHAASIHSIANNPTASIISYCGSSILMTVANKYLMNSHNFNLTFFLLAVQVSAHHRLT